MIRIPHGFLALIFTVAFMSTSAGSSIASSNFSACTIDQATQRALALIVARDQHLLGRGDCLQAKLEIDNVPTVQWMQNWQGQVGYAFSPVMSTDNGYDYAQNEDWKSSVFIPFNTCQPRWVSSIEVHPNSSGMPEFPVAKVSSWYCFRN